MREFNKRQINYLLWCSKNMIAKMLKNIPVYRKIRSFLWRSEVIYHRNVMHKHQFSMFIEGDARLSRAKFDLSNETETRIRSEFITTNTVGAKITDEK